MSSSAEDRYSLLERAAEMVQQLDYAALEGLLANLPSQVLFEEPELGLYLARAFYEQGRFDEAKVLLNDLITHALRLSRAQVYPRILLLLANVEVYEGALDRATEDYERIYVLARRSGNNRIMAAAMLNIGTIAWLKCEYTAALSNFGRAIAAYQAIGDDVKVAGAHHNIAMVYKELGLLAESELHFEWSREIYTRVAGSKEQSFNAYERALLLNQRGEKLTAEATARWALERLKTIGDEREVAEALRVLGVILLSQGRGAEAQESLEEALVLANRCGPPLLRAEIEEELAVLQSAKGKTREAQMHLERAANEYSKMGTPARAVRAGQRLKPLDSSTHNNWRRSLNSIPKFRIDPEEEFE